MSTYLKPVAQQSQFVSGVPIDLVMQVGALKQQKYDEGIAKLQAPLDIIGASDIVKPSDVEKVRGKLENTVNKINEFSNLDLSNGSVQRQLGQYTSELSSDPELLTILGNNRKYRDENNRVNELIEKDPNAYNAANMAVFQEQNNKWLYNPDNNTYNAKYTPYYNYNKEDINPIISELKKYPEMTRDQIWQDPSGNISTTYVQGATLLGDREVKQLREDKIYNALKSTLSPAAINQFQIDYQFELMNTNPQSVIASVDGRIKEFTNQLTEYQNLLKSDVISPEERTSIQNKIDTISKEGGIIETLNNTKLQIATTGDSSLGMPFSSYLDNKLKGISTAHAFTQQGKFDYDELFVLDKKHKDDLELENMKSSLKIKETEAKNNAESSEAAQYRVPTLFSSIAGLTLGAEGSTQLASDDIYKVLNVGKVQDNGSVDIQLNGRKIIINPTNLPPALQGANNNVISGNMELMNSYKNWINTDEGKKLAAQTARDAQGNPIISRSGFIISETGQPVTEISKSFDEFLSSEQGQGVVKTLNEKYGTDVTNPETLAAAKAYISSPQGEAYNKYGQLLDGLTGMANFNANVGGGNMTTDVNGEIYVSGVFTTTRGQLREMINARPKSKRAVNIFGVGVSDSTGEDAIEEMISSGLLTANTSEESDEQVLSFRGNIKGDLNQNTLLEKELNELYTTDKGNLIFKDAARRQTQELFRTQAEYKANKATYLNSTVEELSTQATEKINSISSVDTNAGTDLAKILELNKAVLNTTSTTPEAKMRSYNMIGRIMSLPKNATREQIASHIGIQSTEVGSNSGPTGIQYSTKPIKFTSNIPLSDNIAKQASTIISPPADLVSSVNKYGAEYGVPSEVLLAMAFAESNYGVNKESAAGALGMMQLMPDTASELGVTDRLNTDQSVMGAAKYMNQLYKRFGNWDLAIAAYNSGPNVSSYSRGQIPDNGETRQYVGKVKTAYNILRENSSRTPIDVSKIKFDVSGKSGLNSIGALGIEIGNSITDMLGYKPTFTSAHRDSANNRNVGGSSNSFHLTGDAVDMKPSDYRNLTESQKNILKSRYDVIDEGDHIHIEPKTRS